MKKLFKTWLSSVAHLGSSVFCVAVGRALMRAFPCFGLSLGIFAAICALSCFHVPYISLLLRQILHLIPPLVAMMASPFYVPFLIRSVAVSHEESMAHWWVSVWWSCLVYGLIAGILFAFHWVCTEGSLELLLGLIGVLALLAPLIAVKLCSFPIASVATIFTPMSHRSSREVWRHARAMTWKELPGIILLMLAMAPLSYGSFCLSSFLVRHHFIAQHGAYMIIHGVNILSWEIGWVAFMVFYQQRKTAYIS
ncbi:MAG: hypothetical protein QG604_740 [Candidatus Dependentiae bacterium]|nr:hypothetical protein [Candidatus Dependentiae bacterium]